MCSIVSPTKCSMFNLKYTYIILYIIVWLYFINWIRSCRTCEKSFASELGLKNHLAKTKDCGSAAKKVKIAKEIKRRASRNLVLKKMKMREVSGDQKLSVKHKRGAALSRAEKEIVLHTYESYKSMYLHIFNTECFIWNSPFQK